MKPRKIIGRRSFYISYPTSSEVGGPVPDGKLLLFSICDLKMRVRIKVFNDLSDENCPMLIIRHASAKKSFIVSYFRSPQASPP